VPARASGWINGGIAVVIFGGSMPATRAAVADFDAVFLTGARACIAATVALALLLLLRQRRPERADLIPLVIVASGVVLGFPLLSSLALREMTSAQSLVFMGLLPLTTALFAVLRGGERPRPVFWVFALLGSLCVAGLVIWNGVQSLGWGSVLMLAAILVCGLGYAEGGRLSRRLGGWQVISWALVLAVPVMVPVMLLTAPGSFQDVGPAAWWGLGYVALFSMLLGFVFWYRGLAQGGIAAVGQLQLLQPFLGLGLSALLLGETVSTGMIAATLGAVVCVAGARRFV
jgi:drug/metabolite transporter (DMT)-like permease